MSHRTGSFVVFFFQAEDGIRDYKVTGVQTCALPICLAAAHWARMSAIFYGASAEDAARAGFDDALLYEEFRKDPEARSMPATQLIAGEAWESFAAWMASAKKIIY